MSEPRDTLWINTGELSGDMHGALLLRALRERAPDLEFCGMGGPMLRRAGLDARFRIEDLSVMGITEVLGRLPKIFSLLSGIKAELTRLRPRAVVVIDAPDFHFRVIKIARALDIPVYYYISPKLWAWRQNRAAFIRRHVRRLISILPFEVPFYRRFGMEVDYVGNPLVDVVDYPRIAAVSPKAGRIGFLPGSRTQEVASLMPEFGKAARLLRNSRPDLEYVCLRAPNMAEPFLRSFWPEDVPLSVLAPENRWAAMRRCELLVAASGTATLESAIAGLPTIVTYKVSPLSYFLGRRLVSIPYISLPNLILGREVFPELLQGACDAEPLSRHVLSWLDPAQADRRARVQKDLETLRQMLGPPGAPGRAADCILDDLF